MAGFTVPPASRGAAAVTLTWPGDELLASDAWNLLCGRGAPFERVKQEVLGTPVEVFAQRAPHLPAVLAGAVARTPDVPYLVCDGPHPRSLTFAGAYRRALAYAEVLASRYGIGPGDRVAVAAPNSLEYVLAIWATVSLGAVVAGLNGWWTPAELDHGIALTEPKLLLGAGRPLERLAATQARARRAIALSSLGELDHEAGQLTRPLPGLPRVDIAEDDPATIMFTSGTTGRAKGATLSHRNLVHFGLFGGLSGAAAALAGGGGLRQVPAGMQRATLCVGPLFHISGAGVTLSAAPAFGTKLVFPQHPRWDAERALELTERHGLTQWSGVPTHFWQMLTHPRFADYRTGQVTTIGSGGAAFAPELLRLIERKMPGVQITNGFGMTETTGMGTMLKGARIDSDPGSVGEAAPTMQVQVRDDHGAPLAEGDVGEIYIRGAGVFLGYWNDPAATDKALTHDRWYRSGDYGRIVDGALYLEGRMRDLIIRGGENIYPIEIEYRLVEHPGVADAAVIGVPHPVLGQEVKAFVVPQPGALPTADELRAWAGLTLAAYKVPVHVEFRDSLPYNDTGKVMKRFLEEEIATG
jgi:acyl-CoA synthetase (AMP-forming)/AMP-acid ligase II